MVATALGPSQEEPGGHGVETPLTKYFPAAQTVGDVLPSGQYCVGEHVVQFEASVRLPFVALYVPVGHFTGWLLPEGQ